MTTDAIVSNHHDEPKPRPAFLKSLAVKVGVAIVLAEILVLSIIGTYYVRQLSVEIDAAAEQRVHAVSVLLQESLLKYAAIADRAVMTELVGEELTDGMVIGATGHVFHALDPADIGRAVEDIDGLDPAWFKTTQTEKLILHTTDDTGSYVVGITPIFTLDSSQPFLFAYLKVNTTQLDDRKAAALNRVVMGSLFCIVVTTLIIFLSFNRMILARIRSAVTFTGHVRAGQLNERMPKTANDEIGLLESGLNNMAEDLQRRGLQRDEAEDQLREANETLEARVEQRTAELKEAVNHLEKEVEEHKMTGRALRRQSSIVRLLQRITVAANESATVEDALQVCLDSVCGYFGWPVGHVFMLREGSSEEMISTGLWHIEDRVHFGKFRKAAENLTVTLGEGLPGRVMRSGSPVWVTGGARRTMRRAGAAEECGLMAGFAFPVLVGREVVAVLEFFSTSGRRPESDLFEIMRDVGVQLGRVVERKRSEKQLQQAMEQADQANRAKSGFLSNLSHELRTPMNAIVGFSELLRGDERDPLTERQSDQVATILKAAHHTVRLIDQVLDLAKIEAGHYELDSEWVPAGDVYDYCAGVAKQMAQSHEVELRLTEGGKVPNVSIFADHTALSQAILNIVSNAINYAGAYGPVEFFCEQFDGNNIRFVIRDQGPGIAQDDQEKVFQPFQRLAAGRRQADGTGIGLNITRHLVAMMGARLTLESEVDKGAEFTIEFTGRAAVAND
ncbi:ATP-binding protein [Aestuariispira ectoiniformans]|uniref:ATP-binding protein n=1 Tax=Aestuariispira ectoiniformans TaxID=2775080 RepID=UPI00223B3EE1|nr:ATP-binding protein [Aestuariispira ectoiniformans]